MTGMPSSVAFLTAGRIASESMARMMRTLAPLEMRSSTSVNCLVGEAWASAEMYLAPCAASAFLIAASSVFHRSSWKFDHETPTVRSFAIAAKETTLAEASKTAPIAKFAGDFMTPSRTDPRDFGVGVTKARANQPKPDNSGAGQWSCDPGLSVRPKDYVQPHAAS